MEEIKTILNLAGSLTVAGLLLLIVVSIMRGWLVTWREYEEMRRQRDQQRKEAEEWKRMALQGTRIATYAVRVAEKVPSARSEAAASRDTP